MTKMDQVNCALEVLQGKFVSNEKEYQKYETIDMISCDQTSRITRVEYSGYHVPAVRHKETKKSM